MKIFLPKTSKNTQGFTLIELLIVISIIAILSVIGVAVFGGVQKNARDAGRKADIDAIANAMEVNYAKTNAGQYDALADTMFSQGSTPKDPMDTKTGCGSATALCIYCALEGGTAQTSAQCPATGAVKVAPAHPSGGATNLYWKVCANLENGTNQFYCRGNQQ